MLSQPEFVQLPGLPLKLSASTPRLLFSGVELRNAKTIDGAGSVALTDLLQSAGLSQISKKYPRSTFCFGGPFEILTQELSNQFANPDLEQRVDPPAWRTF